MTYEPNMTVTRTEKTSGFTCIDNRIIRDESLSATARFAMIHLLSVHEQKWNINEQGLSKVLKIGIKAVKKVIAELVNCGYLFKMQIKDEQTKQFGHNWYWIYESPELNPHFGKSESKPEIPAQNEPDFFEPEPSERKLSDGQASQLNTNTSNPKKLNPVCCQSVEGKTDGFSTKFSTENKKPVEKDVENSKKVSPFTLTATMLREMTEYDKLAEGELKEFVSETIRHIDDIISCGTADPNQIIKKIQEIRSVENSLLRFMNKLKPYCEKALENLKHPKSRDKFLRKVISAFLLNYKPSAEKPYQRKEYLPEKEEIIPETAIPFGQMLLEMHHPDVTEENYQQYPFDTQEHFIQHYGDDCYYWNKDDCYIPESFLANQTTMLNALNFLFSACWSKESGNTEFKQFSHTCVTLLSEALCTGKRSYAHITSPSILLSHINYLNLRFYGQHITLRQFMTSFHWHFRDKIETYSVKSNYKGYLTSMLVSYLGNEYTAKLTVRSIEFDVLHGDEYDDDDED